MGCYEQPAITAITPVMAAPITLTGVKCFPGCFSGPAERQNDCREAGREHNDFTAMAEQTMVALLWQQGDARGTLNLPASTKVEDLKLRHTLMLTCTV